jgi:hypothetical protein
VCQAGGEDLNAWLVSLGWALAYRHYSIAYVGEEDAARASHLGIWRGSFTAPWDWRRGDRAVLCRRQLSMILEPQTVCKRTAGYETCPGYTARYGSAACRRQFQAALGWGGTGWDGCPRTRKPLYPLRGTEGSNPSLSAN